MSTGHASYQHRSNIRRTELLHERCAELLTFIVCTFTVLVVVSSPHQQRFTATRPTATSSVSTLQESARGGLNSVLLVEGRNTLAFSTGSTIHKCVEIRSSWSTPTSGTVDSIFNNLEFRSLRVTSVGVSFTMVMPIAINANSQSLTNVFWRLRYRDSSNVPKGLVQYSDASPTLTTSTTTTRTYSLTFTLVFGITHLYRLLESLQGDVCFDITNTLIPATTLSIAGTVSTSGYIYLNSMMIFNGSSFSNYASCNTACASTGYGGYAFASISSDANSIAQALMTKYPSTTAWIGLTSTSSTFSASACCYTQWTTVGTTVYNTCVAGLSNTPSSTYTSPLVGSCANGNTYKLTASTGQWTTQTAALTACLCSGTTTDIQWSSGRAYSVLTGRWDTSSHTISPTQTRGSFSWQASTSTSNSRSNEASLSKTISSSFSDSPSARSISKDVSESHSPSMSRMSNTKEQTMSYSSSSTFSSSVSRSASSMKSFSLRSPSSTQSTSPSRTMSGNSVSVNIRGSHSSTLSYTREKSLSHSASVSSSQSFSKGSSTRDASNTVVSPTLSDSSMQSLSRTPSMSFDVPSLSKSVSPSESASPTKEGTLSFSNSRSRNSATRSAPTATSDVTLSATPSVSDPVSMSHSTTTSQSTSASPSQTITFGSSTQEATHSRSLSPSDSSTMSFSRERSSSKGTFSGSLTQSSTISKTAGTLSSSDTAPIASLSHTPTTSSTPSLTDSTTSSVSLSEDVSTSMSRRSSTGTRSATQSINSPTKSVSVDHSSDVSVSRSASLSSSLSQEVKSQSKTITPTPTASDSVSQKSMTSEPSLSHSPTSTPSNSQEGSTVTHSASPSVEAPSRSISVTSTSTTSNSKEVTISVSNTLSESPTSSGTPTSTRSQATASLVLSFTRNSPSMSASLSLSKDVSMSGHSGTSSWSISKSTSNALPSRTSTATASPGITVSPLTQSVTDSASITHSKASQSGSHSQLLTETHSTSRSVDSASYSATANSTMTPPPTASPSNERTSSNSVASVSTTPSPTPSTSVTVTPTVSVSPSPTPTITLSFSNGATNSSTIPLSFSRGKTLSRRSSVTKSVSLSPGSKSMSPSNVVTGSVRSFSISKNSLTPTPSVTDSHRTETDARSQSDSDSVTLSAEPPSVTESPTFSLSNDNPSGTRTASPTGSPTPSPSTTTSPSLSDSVTPSLSPTLNDTWTRVETFSKTLIATPTLTGSATEYHSSTDTITGTMTLTTSVTVSYSTTISNNPSATITDTRTLRKTPTRTEDASATESATTSISASQSREHSMTFASDSTSKSQGTITPSPSMSSFVSWTTTESSDATLTETKTITPPPTPTHTTSMTMYVPTVGNLASFLNSIFAVTSRQCTLLVVYIAGPSIVLILVVLCLIIVIQAWSKIREGSPSDEERSSGEEDKPKEEEKKPPTTHHKKKKRRQKKCSSCRAAVIHHAYLAIFFPCSLKCFASHLLVALQETLMIIFMIAVLRTAPSLSVPSFISTGVILVVCPLAPIPLHMIANALLSMWYVTDLDCARAIRRSERKALRDAKLGTVLRFEYLGASAVTDGGDHHVAGDDDTASSVTVQSVDSRTLARRKRRADAYARRMERRATTLLGGTRGSMGEGAGGDAFSKTNAGGAKRMASSAGMSFADEGPEDSASAFGFEHGDFTLVSGANGMMSAFFTPATAGGTATRAATGPSADDAMWNPALWDAAGAYVEPDGSVKQRLATLNDAVIEILEDEQEAGGDVGDLFVDLATAEDPAARRQATPRMGAGGRNKRLASVVSEGGGSASMAGSRRSSSTFGSGIRGRTIDVVQHTYHGRVNLYLLAVIIVLLFLIFVANRGANCDDGGSYSDFTFYCWMAIAIDFVLVQPVYVASVYGYRSLRADDEVESADDQSSRAFAFLHPIPGRLRRVNIPDDAEDSDVANEENLDTFEGDEDVGGYRNNADDDVLSGGAVNFLSLDYHSTTEPQHSSSTTGASHNNKEPPSTPPKDEVNVEPPVAVLSSDQTVDSREGANVFKQPS